MEELSASFNSQDQVPDDLHTQDRQCATCIFTIPDQNLQGYPRRRTSRTFPFNKCHLWIPVVSQGVACFHSVDLGCSWTFTVIIFNDPRGSTLFVTMYISFA
jgi:hypothetical protein